MMTWMPAWAVLWAAAFLVQEPPPDPAAAAADTVAALKDRKPEVETRCLDGLKGLSSRDAQGRSVWRALRRIVLEARAGLLDATEARAIAAHVEAHPPAEPWTPERLAAATRSLEGVAEHPARMLLSRAYFDELLELKPEAAEPLAAGLQVGRDADGAWVDRAGELVWQLRDALEGGAMEHALAMERFSKSKDFPVLYMRAVVALKAALANRDLFEEASKAFAAAKKGCPDPEHAAVMSKAAKDFVPCKRCGGQGGKECTLCKGSGKQTQVCGHCNGSGKLYKGMGARSGPVIVDCGTCGAKGKWPANCVGCQGSGRAKCVCSNVVYKAPAYEDLAAEETCGTCEGSGSIYKRLRSPCPACAGLGKFLIPKADSAARLPAEPK